MRTYLQDFFKTFSYEAADTVSLLACYDRIQAHPEACALWEEAVGMYTRAVDCDYEKAMLLSQQAGDLVQQHEYTSKLLLFICMSKQLKEYYAQRGIDPEIYHNSMLDLRYKLEECKLVWGIPGSFVAGWFVGFFKLTRFALGRLQFEIIPFNREYTKDGIVLTPESKVINVHIPRTGTPMDPESCDAAFRQAKAFFAGQWSEPCTFHCGSWLLFPAHREILPAHSNVYKFMERFEIVAEYEDREGRNLWRLFDTYERNPDRLPADSSMRRNYIAYLKQGRYPGSATGIFFL